MGGSCHWFTATASPDRSIFKPFFFLPNKDSFTSLTKSPQGESLKPKERKHPLWAAQETAAESLDLSEKMKSLERQLLEQVKVERGSGMMSKEGRGSDLFTVAVDKEMNLYQDC